MKNETKRTSNLSILYIENDLTLQQKVISHLKKIFSNVYQAYDGEGGINKYIKYKPDIILTDLDLSKKNAFEMIIDIQDMDSKIPIIVLSNKNDHFELLETLDLGLIALLQKPLHLNTLNKALQKVISLKPNKVKPPKVIIPKEKTIVTDSIKEKQEKPLQNKLIKKEPIKITSPEIDYSKCDEVISRAVKEKTNVQCVNNYKGLIISNEGQIIKFVDNLFTLQVTKTQLFSIAHEKHIVITIGKEHILAKLLKLDKNNNQITLKNPQFIQYKKRDSANKRTTVDNSFKATIGYDNLQKVLIPCDVSSNFISVETTEQLDLKENSSIEITMGFDLSAPSTLIHEKKFTKVFATGTIKRIQQINNHQKIIIEHKIQQSGQNIYKKYLQQREIQIINEFKMKMKS